MFKHRCTLIGAIALTLAIALALAWAEGPGARAQEGALELEAPSALPSHTRGSCLPMGKAVRVSSAERHSTFCIWWTELLIVLAA